MGVYRCYSIQSSGGKSGQRRAPRYLTDRLLLRDW